MSSRCICETSWKRFEDVLKMSWQDVLKMSWRRLEDVLKTSWRSYGKMSWRRLEGVWTRQIYWSWPRRLEDVLKTSSEDVRLRRTYSSWSRRLPKTKTKGVFKTSSRRLHQDECLLGEDLLCKSPYSVEIRENILPGLLILTLFRQWKLHCTKVFH